MQQAVVGRQALASAAVFSRCVTAGDGRLIRDVVDGVPYRSRRADALDFLIQVRSACYPGLDYLNPVASRKYGYCHPRGQFANFGKDIFAVAAVCQAFYDRGAIVEQALKL